MSQFLNRTNTSAGGQGTNMKKKRYLVLSDGTVYEGFAFGADVSAIGELVFTSSSAGKYRFAGAQATKLRPILAQPTMRELPML